MFVYLIIAIELAVLYFVFWLVFLREPRPCEVRAELWGSYFPSTNQQIVEVTPPQNTIKDKQIDFYLPNAIPPSRLYRASKMKKMRGKNAGRHSNQPRRRCRSCQTTNHYASQNRNFRRQANRTVVEKFLLSLNKVLNRLSVKVP